MPQNQNCLLVTRQNDNHSPGPGPRRLVPSSHQRSELSSGIRSSVGILALPSDLCITI